MSIDPQTSRFWKETLRHGLLDEPTLRSCWEAIPPDKREDPDSIDRRMARQAVAASHLTLWQAQQVVAGRASALRIGKYVILDIIGKGGMGLVFLARDTRLRRPVALKILSRERMSSPRAVARFEREAKVGAQLQHDNLVRIYDEGEHRDLRYLVMEYIEGRNVAQILAEVGRLTPPLAASIARQVALGLEHARLKELIHRDVNPQNILVTQDGTAKLTDLGLAIDLGDPDDVVTRDGATVGTFDYISPEQARHPRSVDTRSDLYSLGCTLYHMLSGRVPFGEASLPQKLYAHQLHEPDPLSEAFPDIPEGLDAVVRRLMAKSPDDRFPTPQALAEALGPFAEGAPPLAEILAEARLASEQGTEAAESPGTIPLQEGSDPNGYRLGPEPGRGSDTPTRTASAMKPEPQRPAARGVVAASPSSSIPPGAVPSPVPDVPQTEAEPPASPFASGLGLAIDLGPEPSLTETLASARNRSRSTSSRSQSDAGSTDKAAPAVAESPEVQGGRRRRIVQVALGAAGAAALLIVGIAAFAALTRDRSPSTAGADAPGDADVARNDAGLPGGGADPGAARPGDESAAGRPALSVGRLDGTGLIPCATFQDALMMAPNNGGTLYISDKAGPIRMADGDSAFLTPRSSVLIRPYPGTRPSVVLQIEGKEPWLRQQVGSLSIEDLDVVVRYGGPASAEEGRPPLIASNGELTIRRCTFSVQAGPSLESRVVQSFGAPVRVEGCLFRGFDRPLDLTAFGGIRHEISNCQFVWTRGGPGRPTGWPIRVASSFANQPRPARLTVDRCTVLLASGLVEASSLLAEHPVEIHVSQSAIRADHLLSWVPPSEGESFPSGLSWAGKDNRYDLQGASWLVSTPDGLSTPEGAPTDLDSWIEALGDEGSDDSIQALIEVKDPSALESSTVDPSRFASVSDDEPVGADPAQIGPPGRPSTPASPAEAR